MRRSFLRALIRAEPARGPSLAAPWGSSPLTFYNGRFLNIQTCWWVVVGASPGPRVRTMSRDRDLRLDVVAQWRRGTFVLLPIGKARPSNF
jgi:hypothetical protein